MGLRCNLGALRWRGRHVTDAHFPNRAQSAACAWRLAEACCRARAWQRLAAEPLGIALVTDALFPHRANKNLYYIDSIICRPARPNGHQCPLGREPVFSSHGPIIMQLGVVCHAVSMITSPSKVPHSYPQTITKLIAQIHCSTVFYLLSMHLPNYSSAFLSTNICFCSVYLALCIHLSVDFAQTFYSKPCQPCQPCRRHGVC